MTAALLYPFILVAGALQAIGNAMAYHTPAAPGAGGPGPRREEDIAFPAVEPAL